jgi:hypothetical protein
MLREMSRVRQDPDEPARRWFADDYFDLIVWMGPDGEISGFQLCYDKPGDERALTWQSKTGFQHNRVDSGDLQRPFKASPILITDGHFDAAAAARLFREHSTGMDKRVAEFILQQIGRYHPATEAQ